MKGRHVLNYGPALALAWGIGTGLAQGQAPTIDTGPTNTPGGISSSLGPLPGSGVNSLGSTPGGGASTLTQGADSGAPISGRAGPTGTRAPASISDPSAGAAPNDQPLGITAPAPRERFSAPPYGSYSLPSGPDDEGPPDGMTLDMAIDRLIRENLDLRAKSLEIPQAQADVLNAGLRNNPVFYADAQLVPYGQYTRQRPGGQTQYDVNISLPPRPLQEAAGPHDLRRPGQARHRGAQYQNAVRAGVDLVYNAFVNVLAARQTVALLQGERQGADAAPGGHGAPQGEGPEHPGRRQPRGRPARHREDRPGGRRGGPAPRQARPGQPPEHPRGAGRRPRHPRDRAGPRAARPPGRRAGPAGPGRPARRGRLQARHRHRPGQRPPPAGQRLPRRVRPVPALHAAEQHPARPQEPDLLGLGRHGAGAGLQTATRGGSLGPS